MSKHVHGYLIKYALTKGIWEVTGELWGHGLVRLRLGGPLAFYAKEGRDFFRTREEAEEKAREAARRKIAGLEKQLVKLRKLAETPKWAKEKLR